MPFPAFIKAAFQTLEPGARVPPCARRMPFDAHTRGECFRTSIPSSKAPLPDKSADALIRCGKSGRTLPRTWTPLSAGTLFPRHPQRRGYRTPSSHTEGPLFWGRRLPFLPRSPRLAGLALAAAFGLEAAEIFAIRAAFSRTQALQNPAFGPLPT